MTRQSAPPALARLRANWEVFAQADPMWAILMDPAKLGGKWETDAFLATGETEITTVLAHLENLGILPSASGNAMDFGCGIGRLTQALARRFSRVTGIDISATMVEYADNLNGFPDSCRYVLNQREDLSQLASGSQDLIYSSVVLQHMHPDLALAYLREFGRVLKAGGVLVFQLPDSFAGGRTIADRARQVVFRARRRAGIRTRARKLLRRVGVLRGGSHIRDAVAEMHGIAEARVRNELETVGLEIIDVQFTNSTASDFSSGMRYLDSAPEAGFVSKQYCAIKPSR